MTDWNGWPEDTPDFDAVDGADLPVEYGDDGGLALEGFDAVNEGLGVDDLSVPDSETVVEVPTGPIGYDGVDAHVDEPLGGTFDDPAGDETPDIQEGFGTVDPPVGTDPDLDPQTDAWPEPVFPEPVDLGAVPEPADGFPWVDPTTLGDVELPAMYSADLGTPDPAELADYAAEQPDGQDPWGSLAASTDPATSALARWWSSSAVA